MAMLPEDYAQVLEDLDREHEQGSLSDALWEVRRTQVLARASTVRTWPVSFLIFCGVLFCLAGLAVAVALLLGLIT